jgi:hypothetical protein
MMEVSVRRGPRSVARQSRYAGAEYRGRWRERKAAEAEHDREEDLCVVLMTQMLPFLEPGPQALVNDFDRAVYEWRRGPAAP